ncbi:MAG: M48 family metallopeptidase [Kiritimatiellia bacterium]|jgi:Zn-dependent protease with chaperone function
MNPDDFIHPEDAAALEKLKAIPGFSQVLKKFMEMGWEKLLYGENMAQCIRLSPKQLPDLYNHLPPICERLGIQEPEFYLQMDPQPNAWTYGDTQIFVTMTSGLVELLKPEELDAVIAHECGHILCRHVLYHTMARFLLSGVDVLPIFGGLLTLPLKYALLYWERRSELSCDRAAAIVTSPQVVATTMARLAGGPIGLTEKVDFEEWAKQADEYDRIYNDGMLNKTLQSYAVMNQSHPFAAVRVREILKWSRSVQFKKCMRKALSIGDGLGGVARDCSKCGKTLGDAALFCPHCGAVL